MTQFVRGEAGERMMEMRQNGLLREKGMPVMNERVMQFRVGVMILATALIAVDPSSCCSWASKGQPLTHGTYTIYIKFRRMPRA